MKALIFAAGLGERMRPLTDTTPKPLLKVAGKPLIVWHLEKLAALGIRQVLINTSWLAAQFPAQLGDGSTWGLAIDYLHEGDIPLETGGALWNARHWLGEAPFMAVNGDIWTDFDFARLPTAPEGLAHLVVVDNPEHHPHGDFALAADGLLHSEGAHKLTFAGIGVYRPALLDDWRAIIGDMASAKATPPRFPIAPLLRAGMHAGRVHGTHHTGAWTDVGTPERLARLDAQLRTG